MTILSVAGGRHDSSSVVINHPESVSMSHPNRSIASTASLCLLAFSILTANHDNGRLSTRTAISSVRSRNWNHLRRVGG